MVRLTGVAWSASSVAFAGVDGPDDTREGTGRPFRYTFLITTGDWPPPPALDAAELAAAALMEGAVVARLGVPLLVVSTAAVSGFEGGNASCLGGDVASGDRCPPEGAVAEHAGLEMCGALSISGLVDRNAEGGCCDDHGALAGQAGCMCVVANDVDDGGIGEVGDTPRDESDMYMQVRSSVDPLGITLAAYGSCWRRLGRSGATAAEPCVASEPLRVGIPAPDGCVIARLPSWTVELG